MFRCTHGGPELGFLAARFFRFMETHERRRHLTMEREKTVLVLVAEHRRHREVVPLGNRVILVVVAAGALHRQSHEAVARSHHAVVNAILAEFLGNRTALKSHTVKAIIGSGHALILRRVRQKVTRELFGQELVVGLVVVEGLEDPVAPRPSEHSFVSRVAPGVGISGKVEPAHGDMFAEAGGSQHRIDSLLIGICRLIGEEGVNLGIGRRQASQGE